MTLTIQLSIPATASYFVSGGGGGAPDSITTESDVVITTEDDIPITTE